MKKKAIVTLSTILAIILLIFAVAFVELGIALYKGYGIIEGQFLVTNDSYMIIDKNNSPIVMSNQSKNEKIFENLSNGDKIVAVIGMIEETYPARTDVYFLIKISDGEYEDLPESALLGLGELGWIDTPPVTENAIGFSVTPHKSTNTPSGIMFPQIRVINSLEHFNNYINEFDNEFSDERQKYDEKYFTEKSLIVLLLEEGSSSITHTINDLVMSDDGKLYVYIDVNVPEAGDCAMAYWHIFIEPNSNMTDKIKDLEWTDVKLIFNRVELGTGELVKVEKDNKMLSLVIPDGWEYATYETLDHKELSDLAYTFFIEFWPEGKNEGSILFACDENFGVCGTGLECKEVVIGGHTCSMGIYDNSNAWSFITIDVESDVDYFIWNYAQDSWWNEYGTEAMEILDTLEYR
ncbi:MAG: hypothetical protein IKU66_02965 [Clostridia bacterium]|nr:hypothetical protein [Clostridia bacterium]